MSVQPIIGVGTIGTDAGLASVIADLRRRLSQVEAVRTSIADASLTGTQLAAGTIISDNIATGTIIAANIASGTITSELISAGAITAGLIAANAVTATTIAAGAITAGKIAAGAISATNIQTDAITSGAILAGAITADKIASGAVTSDKITVTQLSAITTNMGTLTAGLITGATFQTQSSAAGKVVMDSAGLRGYALDGVTKVFEIDSGTGIAHFAGVANITSTGSVIPGQAITAGSVSTTQLAAGSVTAGKLSVQFNGPNVVKNSGFEYGKYDGSIYNTKMQHWYPYSDAGFIVDAAAAYEGTQAGKLFPASVQTTAMVTPVAATESVITSGAGVPLATHTYKVTAVKNGIETTAATGSVTLSLEHADTPTGLDVTSTTTGSGTNHGGDRYYTVTALTAFGETDGAEEFLITGARKNWAKPSGLGASTAGSRGSGTLPGGEYNFGIVSYDADGSSTDGVYFIVDVPETTLAKPAQPTAATTGSGPGLYGGSDYNFWMVAADSKGVDGSGGFDYGFYAYEGLTIPSNVRTLDLTSSGDVPVVVTWTPSENTYAAGYYLFYEQVGGGDGVQFMGPFPTSVTSFTFDDLYSGTAASVEYFSGGAFALPTTNTSLEAAYSLTVNYTKDSHSVGQTLHVNPDGDPDSTNPDGSFRLQKRSIGNTGSFVYTGQSGWTGGVTMPFANTTDLGGTTYNVSWDAVDGATGYRVYLVYAENDPAITQPGYYTISGGSTVTFADTGATLPFSHEYPTTNTATLKKGAHVTWPSMTVDNFRVYRNTQGRVVEVAGSATSYDDVGDSPNAALQPPTSSIGFPTGGSGDAWTSSEAYPILASSPYVLSGYFKAATTGTAGKTVDLMVQTYDASDAATGLYTNTLTLTNAWQRLVIAPFVTTSTTTHAVLFIKGTGLASGNAVHVDAIQLEKSELVTEYSPRWDDYVPGSIGPTVITPNSITVDQIIGGEIQADWITASSLSAITAELGDVHAGTITGVTITGGAIQTSVSGQRIMLDASSMRFYDSSNIQQLTATSGGLYTGTGASGTSRLFLTGSGLYGYNSANIMLMKLEPFGKLNFYRDSGAWGSIYYRDSGSNLIGAVDFAEYAGVGTTSNTTSVRGFSGPSHTVGMAELLGAPGGWNAESTYTSVKASYTDGGAASVVAYANGVSRGVINNAGKSSFVSIGSSSNAGVVAAYKIWKGGQVTFTGGLSANSSSDVTFTVTGMGGNTYALPSITIFGDAAIWWYVHAISGDNVTIRFQNTFGIGSNAFTAVLWVFTDA